VISTRTVQFPPAQCDFRRERACQTQECNFDTLYCDYATLECDLYLQSNFYTQNVISTRTNVISTRTRLIFARIVRFPHTEFDFTREYAWHVCVWIWHSRVWFLHARVWFKHCTHSNIFTWILWFYTESVLFTHTRVSLSRTWMISTSSRLIFLHAEYDFHTHSVVLHADCGIHWHESNFDICLWEYNTHECDFTTHKSDFYTQTVILLHSRVIMTFTSVG
jgi:hypothetical protein